jgi:hypothetical protein
MYLTERANELHATAKKYFQWMVSPITANKPGEKPRLHLPTMDLFSKHNAEIMRMDLKAIQRHLIKKSS